MVVVERDLNREPSLEVAPDANGAVSFAVRPREHGHTVVSAGVLASYLIPVPALLALRRTRGRDDGGQRLA